MKYLILGLSLDGSVFGVGIEGRSWLHEFSVYEQAYTTIAFRNWDGWALPARNYQELKTLTFQWLTSARIDGEFLGAQARYGVGLGLGLRLENAKVQLVDSSFMLSLDRVDFFPVIAVWGQIFANESNALKLIGSIDLSQRYPYSGQLTLLFVMAL